MADNTYGLHLSPDLIGGTIEGMDIDNMSQAQLMDYIDARTEARNKSAARIFGAFSRPTLETSMLIGQEPDLGEMPLATETDRGRRRKTVGQAAAGFPVYKFLQRSAWTRDYLAKASNWEILRFTESVMNSHTTANYNHALRRLTKNTDTSWSNTLFPEDGVLVVKGLVAGNSDFTPPEWQGTVHTGTHNHYLAGGGGGFDQADLVTAADHIRHHGYAVSPSMGGMGGILMTWINSAQRATFQGFTGHVATGDPIVQDINKIYVQGNLDEVIGYNSVARTYIRELPFMPSGYFIMFATNQTSETDVNGFAPLWRRIPRTGALQGLRRLSESTYPLVESFWEDWFGFGVYNRISAVVMQDAAAYSIPTI